jgi:signal transduction histidine kinase
MANPGRLCIEFENRNILLLDDEQIFCTLLTDVLTPYGYQLDAVTNSKEALELLDKKDYAVALFDYNLAESTTGLDLIKELRAKNKPVEMIMITGNPSLEVALEAFEEGLYDYLVKPVNVRKVKQVLDRALEKYHLKQQQEKLHQDLSQKNRELNEINRKLTQALEDGQTFQNYLATSQKLAGVGEMSASIAHEFNNILGAIRGYTQLALRKPDNPEFLLDCHRKISSCTGRAAKVINNLLLFSRRVQPNKEANCINSAIEETLAISKHHLDTKTITVTTEFAKIPPFKFDTGQLQQVFLNLIMNAYHAMGSNGTLSVSTAIAKDMVKICFQDNGKGISEENLDKIFIPFFTTKSPESKESDVPGSGTGLGLFVSKKIVSAHNGEIKVSSQKGTGTSFEIFLPLGEAATSDEETAEETDIKTEKTKTVPRALVVDDESDIRNVLCTFLESKGIETEQAVDGQDCLDFLARDPNIQLIFMDMTMPRVNGEEALFSIKERMPHIVVYMMSGYGTKRKIHNILALGADRYISKPFDLDEIEAFVDEDLRIIEDS